MSQTPFDPLTTPLGEWPWTVEAPWTSEQVDALNCLQEHGPENPSRPKMRCWWPSHKSGRVLTGGPLLMATTDGWVCPDPACGSGARRWTWPIDIARGARLLQAMREAGEMS
jgi:hypothetical protein